MLRSVFRLIVALTAIAACASIAAAQSSTTLAVTVMYPLPSGYTMYLRGDHCGLNWSQGLLLDSCGQDTFCTTLTVAPSEIGQVASMKVLVNDSMWQSGANSAILLQQDTTSVSLYPWFLATEGTLAYENNIYSSYFQNYRDIAIYLPPSYNENPYRMNYTTLVMHDGSNLFNASTAPFGVAWMCQDTVNQMIAEGSMTEIIIVGVYQTDNRDDEYTYSYDPSEKFGGQGDEYLDFLENTVLPYIADRYRISTDRKNLALLGSSLGGLISCYAGWTRSAYGKVGCMSSSFWWNTQDFNTTVMLKPAPKDTVFYLDSGDQGDGNDDEVETQTVRDHMASLGLQYNSTLFYYLDHGGEHNEQSWGARFWVPMQALFSPLS